MIKEYETKSLIKQENGKKLTDPKKSIKKELRNKEQNKWKLVAG